MAPSKQQSPPAPASEAAASSSAAAVLPGPTTVSAVGSASTGMFAPNSAGGGSPPSLAHPLPPASAAQPSGSSVSAGGAASPTRTSNNPTPAPVAAIAADPTPSAAPVAAPVAAGAPAPLPAAPGSPPSASKQSDGSAVGQHSARPLSSQHPPVASVVTASFPISSGAVAAAPAGAGGASGGNTSGDSSGYGQPTGAGASSGGGGSGRPRYGNRSSDSGGSPVGTGFSLVGAPPVPKGSSASGASAALQHMPVSTASSHATAASGGGGGGAGGGGGGGGGSGHGLAGRGKLQQLGQRLNLGLGLGTLGALGRKKHTSFAPGTAGGSGALSGPEDLGGGGNGGGGNGGGGGGNGGGQAVSVHGGILTSTAPGSVVVVGGAVSNSVTLGSAPSGSSITFGPGGGGGGGGAGGAGGAGGGNGGRAEGNPPSTSSKLPVEEFNPPNHPVNPFSYLATPFRVMAKTKAGVAMGRYATTALRLKRDGVPPASYMWLWLGNFKRWHRRYFVTSEAPGVLLIYKRANMKGKVWSCGLSDAQVVQDDSHPRQIRLLTPAGTIFLRVLRPEERQPWILCLRESVATYRKHKEVVDTFTAAAAAAGEGGEATVSGGGRAASALPSLTSGTVVDQDVEQRRRIRSRLNDRLAELAPLVAEVERHLGVVGGIVAGAATGIGHLHGPLLSHSLSVPHGLSSRGARAVLAAASEAGATTAASSPLAPAAHAAVEDAAAAAAAATTTGAVPAAAGPDSPPGSGQLSASRAAALAVALSGAGTGAGAEAEGGAPERGGPRLRSRSRALASSAGAQAPNLAAAVSSLVEAVRATLHNDAVRITTLEAENAALNKTLDILRAHRSAARTRRPTSISPGGHNAAATAAAAGSGGGGAPAVAGAPGGAEDAASEGSVCTADEDAFDVVEAFDDGVDYSILDDDTPHLHHRLGVDDDEAPYVQHGNYPGGADEEEETDEDAEEDAAELAQQAKVLNALEVVRQVEYITANDKGAALKTLLTTDSPPPPDAEEEEGGKGKRKSRGKGEDTDATLDDEDDDDSEVAISTGGAAGGQGGGALRRPFETRSRLPAPKPLGRGFSIWSILKNMIGRDLTKITMPATINEPLSMTQRLCEVLEYRQLLERAASTPDSLDRMMLVACWLLASHNCQPVRENKPFNPLLGETFEWASVDGATRYICEQVSHHPPVSCFMADWGGAQGYDLYGEIETKTKFWGKTIDCILAGHLSLRLKAFGEEYRFNLGTMIINDIILGRYWVDLSADLKIRNMRTGEHARMIIKPCRGYFAMKDRGKVEGGVYDADGREVWHITGSSMTSLHAALTPEAAAERGGAATTDPQLIWTKDPELPNPSEQYFMTRHALALNDPADPIVPHLPPTDARFRPDMRALELGEWNRATSEKLRLEEKQRTVRRLRKEAGQEHQSRWFRQRLFNTKEMVQQASQPGSVWEFTDEYWDAKAKKDWGDPQDLY